MNFHSTLTKNFRKVAKLALILSPLLVIFLLLDHLAFAFIERKYPSVDPAALFAPLIEVNPRLLSALIMVESSNKPRAINRRTGARGLTQITPVAWRELLKHHRSKYKGLCFREDIYRPDIAKQAGEDYLYIIQVHLKAKGMPVTLDNVLASYVWGETNLQIHGMKKAPRVVKRYISEIKRLAQKTN